MFQKPQVSQLHWQEFSETSSAVVALRVRAWDTAAAESPGGARGAGVVQKCHQQLGGLAKGSCSGAGTPSAAGGAIEKLQCNCSNTIISKGYKRRYRGAGIPAAGGEERFIAPAALVQYGQMQQGKVQQGMVQQGMVQYGKVQQD
eukprot:scaffold20515_cov15-Tisochrysis_lutea.AAC.1